MLIIILIIYFTGKIVHVCPNKLCNRVYKFKSSLINHMKLECGGQRRFTCHICLKKFTQKVTLKNHLAIIHQIIT